MVLANSQKSLKAWTKQKWKTKSGKPSSKTGERYLPEKAIKNLSWPYLVWLESDPSKRLKGLRSNGSRKISNHKG